MMEQTEYWEPWTPRVGQRVRIRLGECVLGLSAEQEGAAFGLLGTPHFPSLHQRIGTIYSVDSPQNSTSNSTGHRYEVKIDGGYDEGGRHWEADNFAAIELEPLEKT